MGFRWGFKTEANDLAREVRRDLGLKLAEPLDPWRLAEYVEIPVIPLSLLHGVPLWAARELTLSDPSAFSAVTVFRGSKRVIIHNDTHSRGRQANNLCHEVSHGLLLHPPTPALDDRGCRDWDDTIEAEATWLAGALLITEEAALTIVRTALPLNLAAERYGVSRAVVQFRLNVTGARKRVRGSGWRKQ